MLSTSAFAQVYPDKSRAVRVLVPFGAASSTDILARALAKGISDVAGLNVIVDNKAGAEGQIGMVAGKTAAPDGYTLVMTTSSTQVLNPHMIPNLAYDPVVDFTPVAGIAKFSLILNAGPSVTQPNLRELLKAARENPGKFSFGSGTATTRLAAELLQSLGGIKLLAVPYKSQTDAIVGLAGGQVDIVFMDLPGSSPHYKSGRVRPLAVTGTSRMSALPDVPTAQEEGLAGYEVSGWWAAYFPAKTPPAIVAAMRDIVEKALKTQSVKDAFTTYALEPLPLTGNAFTAFQQSDSLRLGKLVRDANLASKP
ncbi:Bug family tripartite tricarboxylate transporter substrate binding protein [Variovorax sp. HJSM1_2]|uniref:Bug family tripartite tricarboxylate transporter substrate binding protein n=1 Tax=Variovorax sp. HJSM1_2 TaxID=3366263 RepID=UPI003BC2FD5F